MSTDGIQLYDATMKRLAEVAANRDISKTKWIQKKFEQFDIIIEAEVVSLKCVVSVSEYTLALRIFAKSIEANSRPHCYPRYARCLKST